MARFINPGNQLIRLNENSINQSIEALQTNQSQQLQQLQGAEFMQNTNAAFNAGIFENLLQFAIKVQEEAGNQELAVIAGSEAAMDLSSYVHETEFKTHELTNKSQYSNITALISMKNIAKFSYKIKMLKFRCSESAFFDENLVFASLTGNQIDVRKIALSSFITEWTFKDNILTIPCNISINDLSFLAVTLTGVAKNKIVNVAIQIDNYKIINL